MKRPTQPLTISIAALVVALGGTSYDAVKVGSGDIRTGAVNSRTIADNNIRSIDVKNGTLTPKDFKDGLPGGAQGPQGPAGADGVGRWALIEANGTISA